MEAERHHQLMRDIIARPRPRQETSRHTIEARSPLSGERPLSQLVAEMTQARRMDIMMQARSRSAAMLGNEDSDSDSGFDSDNELWTEEDIARPLSTARRSTHFPLGQPQRETMTDDEKKLSGWTRAPQANR